MTVRLESTLVVPVLPIKGDCEQIGICSVTAAGVSVGGTQQAIVGEECTVDDVDEWFHRVCS